MTLENEKEEENEKVEEVDFASGVEKQVVKKQVGVVVEVVHFAGGVGVEEEHSDGDLQAEKQEEAYCQLFFSQFHRFLSLLHSSHL